MVAESPAVSRSKQLWNRRTVLHLVFLCPDELYAACVGSFCHNLVIPTRSNKICMHKSMRHVMRNSVPDHISASMIGCSIYESFFSAMRKAASTGGTVGGVLGVLDPLVETVAAFARRTRLAWRPFSQAAPPL